MALTMHLKLHLEDGFVAAFDFRETEQTSGIRHNENARRRPYIFLVYVLINATDPS